MAPSNPVPDCRPIMATANVRRPSISAIQPMVNCLAGGTGLRIPLAMYRSASNPGKCITRQALVQGVGKR
nr:hypothetical protein [Bacteroides intestinalis]